MKNDEEPTLTVDDVPSLDAPQKRQPYLFVVLQADDLTLAPSRHSLEGIDEVQLRRGSTRCAVRVRENGRSLLVLTLPDKGMSSRHAVFERRGARAWEVRDSNSKNGTFLNGDPVATPMRVPDAAVLEAGHTFLSFRSELDSRQSTPDLVLDSNQDEFATLSPELGRSFDLAAQVAHSTVPVILGGESGTGKEVVARAVHRLSGRKGAFVAVNCAALPTTLVEAELFGFRRGSFSGAFEDRLGLIRAADGGTLFLDEIADLSLQGQAALLRTLQEHEVLPVGAVQPVQVDVRVISASHESLDAKVTARQFRGDLLARLDGCRIRLPPLRDRREDLGVLIRRILAENGQPPGGAAFSAESVRRMMRHSFDGNVRELVHRLRLAVVLSKGGQIGPHHLFGAEDEVGPATPSENSSNESAKRWAPPLSPEEDARREAISNLLRENRGNVTAVARSLGKTRVQVQRWIKRYGLQRFEDDSG